MNVPFVLGILAGSNPYLLTPSYDGRITRDTNLKPAIDLKKLPGARKAPLPEFIPPQLATLVKLPPQGDQWLHEVKFDGYRMICWLNRGKVRFWSRNHKDWTSKFPTLVKAVQSLPAQTAILDGEVVILDTRGRTSFQGLQKSLGRAQAAFIYQIFDVLYLDGYNLTRTPLRGRKTVLETLFESLPQQGQLRYSDHFEGDGVEFYKKACKFGIEGTISKLADSLYESTRNRNWLKAKCHLRQEFVVAGFTISEKALPGFGALILGIYDEKNLVYAGRVGTGFTLKQRTDLRKMLDPLVTTKMPFAVRPKDPRLRQVRWVTPKFVAEVEFTEWTADGSVRHPSFQGLREDKNPKEIVRETPALNA